MRIDIQWLEPPSSGVMEDIEIDGQDCWDLYTFLARINLAAVREFRSLAAGWPGSFDGPDEWNKILDEIIEAYRLIVEGNDDIAYQFDKKRQKKIRKGLKLHAEWYQALWT
jgi:hypothetical protein